MRHLWLAAACVVAGAILQIGVAWIGAVWGQVGPAGVAPAPRSAGMEGPAPGLKWHTRVPGSWGRPQQVIAAEGRLVSAQWADAGLKSAGVIRCGWPARSLRATVYAHAGTGGEEPTAGDRFRAGIELPGRSLLLVTTSQRTVGEIAPGVPQVITNQRKLPMPRRLPVEPIAAGFTLNALAYAGMLAAMLWLVRDARGRVWRWRGRCRACGYLLQGLPAGSGCPECGSARGAAAGGDR